MLFPMLTKGKSSPLSMAGANILKQHELLQKSERFVGLKHAVNTYQVASPRQGWAASYLRHFSADLRTSCS